MYSLKEYIKPIYAAIEDFVTNQYFLNFIQTDYSDCKQLQCTNTNSISLWDATAIKSTDQETTMNLIIIMNLKPTLKTSALIDFICKLKERA